MIEIFLTINLYHFQTTEEGIDGGGGFFERERRGEGGGTVHSHDPSRHSPAFDICY